MLLSTYYARPSYSTLQRTHTLETTNHTDSHFSHLRPQSQTKTRRAGHQLVPRQSRHTEPVHNHQTAASSPLAPPAAPSHQPLATRADLESDLHHNSRRSPVCRSAVQHQSSPQVSPSLLLAFGPLLIAPPCPVLPRTADRDNRNSQ
jgi:hypothetical protein